MRTKRKRIEIKKITSTTARQVTFSKRKKGLFKKAYELSTLCDAEIALVIFSNTGKLFQYSNSRITEVIARRNMASSGGQGHVQDPEDLPPLHTQKQGSDHLLLCNELIKNVRDIRHMRGEDLQELRTEELQQLEISITNSLTRVLEMKLKKLKEENTSLKQIVSNVAVKGDVPDYYTAGNRDSILKSSYSFLQLG